MYHSALKYQLNKDKFQWEDPDQTASSEQSDLGLACLSRPS